MRTLMSGNEAFARAAFEAGVSFVSSYPGTPSTEITEYVAGYPEIACEWASNEKVAAEAALGASLAGRRAMTCMKHVGLNVASEPLMTGSYTGVNAGLVFVVADDPGMHSSQNEQDSRNYARFAKVPMLEPSDSAEALEFTKLAFEISEKFCTPVLVRSETRLSHSMGVVLTGESRRETTKEFEKDISKWVMVPANARKRHPIVEERLEALRKYAGTLTRTESGNGEYGVVCSGVTYQYVKEALPDADVLKLSLSYPVPFEKVKEFSNSVKKLYVVEELDPFIENEIKAAGIKVEPLNRNLCGELSQDETAELFGRSERKIHANFPSVPVRPPNLCPGCSHRGIFYAVSKLKLFAFGDIGCYTLGLLPPLSAVNSTVCMGAGVSMVHGADRATGGDTAAKTVAVIGDSTFLHTGLPGLVNSVYNGGISTVIILDNRITGMTGHQPNPASGFNIRREPANAVNFQKLCSAVGVKRVRTVDPFDVDECVRVLKEETAAREVSVIITTRPCIFADKSAVKLPFFVREENCTGCGICARLGCPAVVWDAENRKAVIDGAMCTGCGLCENVCRFSAITASEDSIG